jgi:transcription elongation factor Elf1
MLPRDLNCPECGVKIYSYTQDALIKETMKYCHECGARFNINEAIN